MSDQSEEIAKLIKRNDVLNLAMQKQFGQVLVIESALLTMIETHPDPALLLRKLNLNLEPTESLLLGGSQSEAGLEAFQESRKRLTNICQMAIDQQVLDT